PPRSDDPNNKWAEDDAGTIKYILNYAHNKEKAEEQAKLEPLIREREQRLLEQREKQQREYRQRELEAVKGLPERQLQSFATGGRYTCGNCNLRLSYHAVCTNPRCQAHTSYSIEPLMSTLRDLVTEYFASKDKKKESNTVDK
ncbi:MAG: hypothetical protein ACJ71X_06085, partial [Nitrososphaeraceae archaeon]